MTKFAVVLAAYITMFVTSIACGIGKQVPAYTVDASHVLFTFIFLAVPAVLGMCIGKSLKDN